MQVTNVFEDASINESTSESLPQPPKTCISSACPVAHQKKNFRACKSSAQGWFTRGCRLCNLTLDVQERLSCKLCSYEYITITLTQYIMWGNRISYHILFISCPFPEDLKGLSCMKHTRGCKHNLELKDVPRITRENTFLSITYNT